MKTVRGLSLLLVLAFMAGAASASDLLKAATYCRSVDEQQAPKEKTDAFYPEETVFLSIELKGRPKTGIASAKFMFQDDLIAEAKVDVAEANSGVLFSIGESTYIAFNLKPTAPLPVGEVYRTEVTFDGKPLGVFPFRVDPPKGAIPSKILSTTLARSVDEKNAPVDETRQFTSLDKVVLCARGDLGIRTWLEADWLVAGKLNPAGTKVLTLEENKKDVPFYFSYIPSSGWPVGEHTVVLLMNGKEAARQTFTITAAAPDAAKKITVQSTSLFHDDGKGGEGEPAAAFQTDEHVLHVKFLLAKPALTKGTRFVWTLIKAAGVDPGQIAEATMGDDGLQRSLTTFLTLTKSLPEGSYRVDLIQGDTVLGSKEFEVKAGK